MNYNGSVVSWNPDTESGAIQDDEFGDSPLVLVNQYDVVGGMPLRVGARVRYDRQYDPSENLYLARPCELAHLTE